MLYCMAFSFDQLKFLSSEIHRVLKPGGLNIYSVRNHFIICDEPFSLEIDEDQ